jgi:hypothetical protein
MRGIMPDSYFFIKRHTASWEGEYTVPRVVTWVAPGKPEKSEIPGVEYHGFE